MPDLSPAPSTLGLASPVLGLWFQEASSDNADIADLGMPDADLGCPMSLPNSAIWAAPAAGLLSLHIATSTRPQALSDLRQANGSPAFGDDSMVFMHTLLPEVASRLASLSHAVPRPDSATAATAGQVTRPVINRLALEIIAGTIDTIDTIAKLSKILPAKDTADLKTVFDNEATDADKAGFVGLGFSGGFSNGENAATILRRPEKDEQRLLQNQSGSPLAVKLWAFDIHGRPFDAGALAEIWGHLAGSDWDNLWAADDAARQRTTSTEDGRTVHLVNAHEGPLEAAIKTRISSNLTDLNAVAGSDVLYTAATSPAIGISAAADADTDTAPLARLAPLPAGPYTTIAAATPFAGWGGASAFTRDFLRVAITDIEAMTTGLARTANTAQADPRRRISAARNTASTVVLPTIDAVASEVMTQMTAASATVQFIAPELDQFWGPQTTVAHTGGDPFASDWDELAFTAHAIAGSGNVTATVAEDQSLAIHFNANLPAGAWIRLWPYGRDTDTGRRFRMTGGAARVDGAGTGLVILPLPNGQNGDGTASEEFAYDLLLVTDEGSRLYTDMRANRPAVDESVAAIDITALAALQTLYCPQTGGTIGVGVNAAPAGAPLLMVNGPISDHDYRALDTTTLRASDVNNALLVNADGDDRIITHDPAFVQTTQGDLPTDAAAIPPERVHNGSFHKNAIGQEMLDFAAYDTTGNQGVVGGIAARAPWHESPPPAQSHAGVSAAPEIHGAGVTVAGPAADALRLLMRERSAEDLEDFISTMGIPITAAAGDTTSGAWTALLETGAKGTHGHTLMSLIPTTFNPGKTWDNADPADQGIKQRIDDVLSSMPGSLTTDSLIDSANFDDSTAAAAFDRVLDKHRNGVQGFARALEAAIQRAEDLIWIQTPAFDNESFAHDDGDIHILQVLRDRLGANPALHCMIVVPQNYLPDRNIKLNSVRKSAIGAALQALESTAGSRVAWVSPVAYTGRAYHMSATTVIVDDVLMLTGSAHLWRRGLVFDSALSASVFDDQLRDGRPQTVLDARRIMAGNLLSIDQDMVPLTAPDLIAAAKALNAGGGFGRANPVAYTAAVDSTTDTEKVIWNPALSASTNWTATLAALLGNTKTEFENGTR